MEDKLHIKCPNCKSVVPIGYPICPYCGYDLRLIIRFRATREVTLRDIINRLKKALLNPFSLFSEILLAPDLQGGFLLLILLSLLLTLRFEITLNYLLPIVPATQTALMRIIHLLTVLLLSFVICFAWAVFYILFLNFFLNLFGAETNFSLSFAILGYSLWPIIIGMSISNIFYITQLHSSFLITFNPTQVYHSFSSARIVLLGTTFITGVISGYGYSKVYMISKFITIPLSILLMYILLVL
ncbi:MAG: zinc ribbon domain-containing protein [Candidatus Njordarchaeales archaeon]